MMVRFAVPLVRISLPGHHRPGLIEATWKLALDAWGDGLFRGIIAPASLKRVVAHCLHDPRHPLPGHHRPGLIEAERDLDNLLKPINSSGASSPRPH